MQRKLLIGLAAALGVTGTLFVTSPAWASESHHGCSSHGWGWCGHGGPWDFKDHFDGDFDQDFDGGFSGTYVACKDGARFVSKKKDKDDFYSVHKGRYKGHKDCWTVNG